MNSAFGGPWSRLEYEWSAGSRNPSDASTATRLHLTVALLKRPCVVFVSNGFEYFERNRLMLRKVLSFAALSLFVFATIAPAQETRHFTFHYGFTVKDIPAGEKVRIWLPEAHSDQFQAVKVVSANGDLSLKKTHESKYGNDIYYAEASKAKQAELHFEV